MPASAPTPCVRAYRPRAAEHTVLHQVVRMHLAAFLAAVAFFVQASTEEMVYRGYLTQYVAARRSVDLAARERPRRTRAS